jgi:hypothetical protein
MKSILIILISLPLLSFAQQLITIEKYIPVWVKEPGWPHQNYLVHAVVLSSGDTIKPYMRLKLGKGSLPNGDYNYIATPSNTMEAKLKRTTKLTDIEIISIMQKGKKKYGYKYVFEAQGRYLIQLEDAIAAGEIILNK